MTPRSPLPALALLLVLAACASGGAERSPAFASNDITVTTRGAGPDVILIHGLGAHVGVWDRAAEALDDRYRLHLVQIHGFGGVSRTNSDSLVAAPVAREVTRYIREARLTRPAIVGHSLGGSIVIMAAARNPGLAGRVMIVDAIPFSGVMFGQPDATVDALRPIAAQLRAQILENDVLGPMIATMVRDEADRQRLLQFANASDRRVVANAMHELIVTDLRPELPRLDVPVTILYAQPEDVPLSREQFDASMRQLYSGTPRATFIRVDESRHYIQLDQTDRFVEAVDAFMQR